MIFKSLRKSSHSVSGHCGQRHSTEQSSILYDTFKKSIKLQNSVFQHEKINPLLVSQKRKLLEGMRASAVVGGSVKDDQRTRFPWSGLWDLGPAAVICPALPRTMSTILPDNKHIIAYSSMDVYVLRNITDLIYL